MRPPLPLARLPAFVAAAVTLALVGPSGPLVAQADDDHLAGWYAVEGAWTPRQGRFGLEADLQLRGFEMLGDFARFSLRSAVVIRSRSLPLSFVAGAGWFLSGEAGPADETRAERRIHQQVNFSHPLSGNVRLAHRLGAEQRWFDEGPFRTRYRYRLGADVALGGQGFTGREVRLVVSDEILVNGETATGGRSFDRLDQNRAYAAVSWPVAGLGRVEAGYLNILTGGLQLHRVRMTVKLDL